MSDQRTEPEAVKVLRGIAVVQPGLRPAVEYIEFLEAERNRLASCQNCGGTGIYPVPNGRPCSWCKGIGSMTADALSDWCEEKETEIAALRADLKAYEAVTVLDGPIRLHPSGAETKEIDTDKLGKVLEERRTLRAKLAPFKGAVKVKGTWWGPDNVWLRCPGDPESCPRVLRVYEGGNDDCPRRRPVTVYIIPADAEEGGEGETTT